MVLDMAYDLFGVCMYLNFGFVSINRTFSSYFDGLDLVLSIQMLVVQHRSTCIYFTLAYFLSTKTKCVISGSKI